jgi:DNA-nicking Smr family endonuclease
VNEEPKNPDPIIDLELDDTLDLHAFHPKDAARATSAFLIESASRGLVLVRIVHGKGIGVMREMVRRLLSESELVESFRDAEEFSGARGATIAKLRHGRRE